MPLWQHLEELRWILFRVIAAVAAAAILSFVVIDQLFFLLMQPLTALSAGNQVVLNLAGPFDGIIIRMKTALMSGFVLALPFNLFFFWNFYS